MSSAESRVDFQQHQSSTRLLCCENNLPNLDLFPCRLDCYVVLLSMDIDNSAPTTPHDERTRRAHVDNDNGPLPDQRMTGVASSVSPSPRRASSRSQSRSRSRSRNGYYRRSQSPSAYHTPAAEPPVQLNYKLVYTLKGHKKAISAVKFSPDGTKIASCCPYPVPIEMKLSRTAADGTIKVWTFETGKHERTFEGHLGGISIIAWSPDSKWIASGADDKVIRLWNVQTV